MLGTPIAKQDVKSTVNRVSQAMPDPFVFVPITQQEAAKGRGPSKRIVRAHVTRRAHLTRTSGLSGHEIQDWTVNPSIHRNAVAVRRKPGSVGLQERRRTIVAAEKDEKSSEETKELSRALTVPNIPVGSAETDPFWTYPVDFQPLFSEILSYCQFTAVSSIAT